MEENIKILEEFKTKGYALLLMEYGDRNKTNLKIEIAIENLIKGYRELQDRVIKYEKTLEKLQKETIWKSKIKAKIEEIQNKFECVNGWDSEFNYAIEILQELMEDK